MRRDSFRTRETVDDASDDELGDVLGAALDGGSDDPDDGGNFHGALAAELVGEEAGTQGTDERASGHGGGDLGGRNQPGSSWTAAGEAGTYTALEIRTRVVEVLDILLGTNPRAHRTGERKTSESEAWRRATGQMPGIEGGAPDIEAEERASNGAEAGEDCEMPLAEGPGSETGGEG